jgi:hypothetical protein
MSYQEKSGHSMKSATGNVGNVTAGWPNLEEVRSRGNQIRWRSSQVDQLRLGESSVKSGQVRRSGR